MKCILRGGIAELMRGGNRVSKGAWGGVGGDKGEGGRGGGSGGGHPSLRESGR